jgi:lipoate-protein ligase A
MAADYALLRAAQDGAAWLRLYRWNPPCLSFGRNEPALSRYDRDQIRERGLDAVRRPTGGRAVWHEAEVTYAMAAPVDLFGSLTATYAAIHQILARALSRLGTETTIARRPAGGHMGVGAGSCFASPAGGEVVVGGRKLVGSAQIREGTAFLQHGSILLGDTQDMVHGLTRGTTVRPFATSLSGRLGRPVSFAEASAAVVDEMADWWDGGLVPARLEPDSALVARFGDPAWTWRR